MGGWQPSLYRIDPQQTALSAASSTLDSIVFHASSEADTFGLCNVAPTNMTKQGAAEILTICLKSSKYDSYYMRGIFWGEKKQLG